jgi:hypothetical protein
MALPFASDLAAILNVDEFAVSSTFNGAAVRGIFDNETIPVETGGYVSVHQEQPRFTCRTSDVAGIAESQVVVIAGVTYVVKAWVHDGTGVTVVQLEKS